MTRQKHRRSAKPLKKVATTRRGTADRRIIGKLKDAGREYTLHATKGYRSSV